MGQQQLLLLVLGMVIVGIAVVAGIQAFSEGKQKAERDAAISDAMRLISDIQAWKLKPSAFGGGANVQGFTGVSLTAIGLDPKNDAGNDDSKYETLNGCFNVSGDKNGATLSIYETNCSTLIATVTITGASPDSIKWNYNSGS